MKLAVCIGFLFAVALADEGIRSIQRETMPVNGLPLPNIKVTAMRKPDFLWAGTAWWIDIETDTPLIIQLDDWQGKVPAGRHKIFSNHDSTNTGEFGKARFWREPKEIKVSIDPLK